MLTILAEEQDAGRLRLRPVVVELAGHGHDPIPFEIHFGCLLDVAVARPCVDCEREGGAAPQQAGDGLGLDDVVDHGDEEAADGRARPDEGGASRDDEQKEQRPPSGPEPRMAAR